MDLAAHLSVARARGIALRGPAPVELLAPVPPAAYLDSVAADLEWILTEDHLRESPYYGVLNLARSLYGAGLGVEPAMPAGISKEEGGAWALAELPERHRPLLDQALPAIARPVW